jgi:molybdopterin/thiamine biosynthesis adenylyltransferase
MKALNPLIQCTAIDIKLTTDNAIDCFKEFDVIVDATDNFEAR